jgi:hypothetical protein
MGYRHATLALVIAAATMLQTGCGSGSSNLSFNIYTLTATGGVWSGAEIYGNANPYTASCTNQVPADLHCLTGFPLNGNNNPTTSSSGEFNFPTDALPATWTVVALEDTTCPQGGSTTDGVTVSGTLKVYCGTLNGTGTEASPASCTVIYLNGVFQGGCPPYLVITTTDPLLPTGYALTAGWYTDEAAGEGSSQSTASSSTQITIPAPTGWGLNVVTIVDPTTNEVLGATDFVVHECLITAGQYGNSETCPY